MDVQSLRRSLGDVIVGRPKEEKEDKKKWMFSSVSDMGTNSAMEEIEYTERSLEKQVTLEDVCGVSGAWVQIVRDGHDAHFELVGRMCDKFGARRMAFVKVKHACAHDQ